MDIVRQARLLAVLDYNNRVRIQNSLGVENMSISKDEYIRSNFEEFRKKAQHRKKMSGWGESVLRGKPPNIKDNPPFKIPVHVK